MADIVKIQIGLVNGQLSVEAPTEALDSVFDRVETFLPFFAEAVESTAFSLEEEDSLNESLNDSEIPVNGHQSENSSSKPRNMPRIRTSSKPKSFNTVPFDWDSAKRDEFRKFYATKKPKGQSEQVDVVMYWLSEHLNLKHLDANDIYTGLKTLDVRVPKNIDAVLSKLIKVGHIGREEKGKYKVSHIGEDFVTRDLPRLTES